MNVLRDNNLETKVKNLIRNFSLMILCYFLFFIVLQFLSVFIFELDLQKYEQIEILESLKENPLKFIFLAAIAAPVIEESIFRSILKPSATSLKIFICAILYLFGLILIPENAHWALKYILLLGVLALIYYAMGELIPERYYRRACYWLHRYYLIIWILGAIIFGFVHIYNYVDTFQLDLVLFLMIFPRIIAGYFFGKIKLENKGMIWPILMHSMNNSLVLIFVLPFTLSHFTWS
ncbi:type II CAAX prenyl endopeptidase Rce1 family protein [Christiangramia sediminis]|uniref:CPBP family intramembrane metalloprotease n=1 Tax=Christiangramia sediminis TaxID=2881336 RepID=A0A9X1LHX3_9FLAO|nr:CPBP family glutamic-type intramembrane protease [Christiangramia sediminis]MCB7480677.1 CPBP family intramembrane metalloprotease [Christiangramia sediminis]